MPQPTWWSSSPIFNGLPKRRLSVFGLICAGLALLTLLVLYGFYGSNFSSFSSSVQASRLLSNTDRVQSSSTESLFSDDEEENEIQRKLTSSELRVKARFLERRRRLDQYCQNLGNISSTYVKFKILTRTGLQVCLIPKIGTQFMKSTDRYLKQKKLYGHPPPKRTFFVVREPYSRLVSGYLGKIVTTPDYWLSLGMYIVIHFRNNSINAGWNKCGSDVSFPEFVKYLIDAQRTGNEKNRHFIPIHEHCEFCQRDYDFIAHLETIKEDVDYMLTTAGLNISKEIDFSFDVRSILQKVRGLVNSAKQTTECTGIDMCDVLERMWWSFQARGLIASDIPLLVSPKECETIGLWNLWNKTLDAHTRSQSLINKSKQKRDVLVKLFLQVPLEDRLELKKLYQMDFDLFGYDSQPEDLFPELSKQ